jgi:hypothetical protein
MRLKELDLCRVAEGAFALVHLPKMPELKNRDLSVFNQTDVSINADTIPYKCVCLECANRDADRTSLIVLF